MRLLDIAICIVVLFLVTIALKIGDKSKPRVIINTLCSMLEKVLIIFIAFFSAKYCYIKTENVVGLPLYVVQAGCIIIVGSMFPVLKILRDSFLIWDRIIMLIRATVVAFIVIFAFFSIVYYPKTDYNLKAIADIVRNPSSIYYYNNDMHLYEELEIRGVVRYHYTNGSEFILIYEKVSDDLLYNLFPRPRRYYIININP